MKSRVFCLLMAILQIITTWYSVTSRPFGSVDASAQQGQIPQSPQVAFYSEQYGGLKKMEGMVYGNEETNGGLSKLGSRPPSCNHKCEGCIPCDAIQIPATTDHVRIQYANYEPEGWKCKCGTRFFNP